MPITPTTAYMAGTLGAAAIGGVSGLFGASSANDANRKEAKRNREFQAMMSSTAHQREVWDLKAAGLNPILSAGGGGASTPSGAQATIQNEGLAAMQGMGQSSSARATNASATGQKIKNKEWNYDTELRGEVQKWMMSDLGKKTIIPTMAWNKAGMPGKAAVTAGLSSAAAQALIDSNEKQEPKKGRVRAKPKRGNTKKNANVPRTTTAQRSQSKRKRSRN